MAGLLEIEFQATEYNSVLGHPNYLFNSVIALSHSPARSTRRTLLFYIYLLGVRSTASVAVMGDKNIHWMSYHAERVSSSRIERAKTHPPALDQPKPKLVRYSIPI